MVPVLAGLLTMVGCGGDGQATVRGKVTLNSQPLTSGQVVFHPTSSLPTAIGHIQSDGSYSLSTGRQPGIAPGEYVVTVQSREPTIEPKDNSAGPQTGALLTPAEYGSEETTPLKFVVEAGSNRFDISIRPC